MGKINARDRHEKNIKLYIKQNKIPIQLKNLIKRKKKYQSVSKKKNIKKKTAKQVKKHNRNIN